ncbi:hypothetical protein DYB25_002146 [Aphanomyces astaci]|uniref:Uncharacterized protein n=1 Tax=Aphanomyces astaci TaxID=112090 RepID=A0A397BEA0_APHAT|nr:hypothetical protein DYB25_002146 [Aphanomyces astaci]
MAQPYQAFHRLHELGASFEHTPKTVHLDVASAMTGVSRFGEQYPAWTYDYQYLNKGVHAKGKGKDQDAGKGGNHRGAGAGKAGGAASGGR